MSSKQLLIQVLLIIACFSPVHRAKAQLDTEEKPPELLNSSLQYLLNPGWTDLTLKRNAGKRLIPVNEDLIIPKFQKGLYGGVMAEATGEMLAKFLADRSYTVIGYSEDLFKISKSNNQLWGRRDSDVLSSYTAIAVDDKNTLNRINQFVARRLVESRKRLISDKYLSTESLQAGSPVCSLAQVALTEYDFDNQKFGLRWRVFPSLNVEMRALDRDVNPSRILHICDNNPQLPQSLHVPLEQAEEFEKKYKDLIAIIKGGLVLNQDAVQFESGANATGPETSWLSLVVGNNVTEIALCSWIDEVEHSRLKLVKKLDFSGREINPADWSPQLKKWISDRQAIVTILNEQSIITGTFEPANKKTSFAISNFDITPTFEFRAKISSPELGADADLLGRFLYGKLFFSPVLDEARKRFGDQFEVRVENGQLCGHMIQPNTFGRASLLEFAPPLIKIEASISASSIQTAEYDFLSLAKTPRRSGLYLYSNGEWKSIAPSSIVEVQETSDEAINVKIKEARKSGGITEVDSTRYIFAADQVTRINRDSQGGCTFALIGGFLPVPEVYSSIGGGSLLFALDRKEHYEGLLVYDLVTRRIRAKGSPNQISSSLLDGRLMFRIDANVQSGVYGLIYDSASEKKSRAYVIEIK